jgi:hypothetical protein
VVRCSHYFDSSVFTNIRLSLKHYKHSYGTGERRGSTVNLMVSIPSSLPLLACCCCAVVQLGYRLQVDSMW